MFVLTRPASRNSLNQGRPVQIAQRIGNSSGTLKYAGARLALAEAAPQPFRDRLGQHLRRMFATYTLQLATCSAMAGTKQKSGFDYRLLVIDDDLVVLLSTR